MTEVTKATGAKHCLCRLYIIVRVQSEWRFQQLKSIILLINKFEKIKEKVKKEIRKRNV